MSANFATLVGRRPGPLQVAAWADSYQVLVHAWSTLAQTVPEAAAWTFIFEYELPREGGRRPDLVLLAQSTVVVIEFKQQDTVLNADLDQVAAYARDLAHYHGASHNRLVEALLVPTRTQHLHQNRASARVASPDMLAHALSQVPTSGETIEPRLWLESAYAPLPSVVQAARHIFAHEQLPNIRQAHSAGIPQALAYLDAIVAQARQQHERHLVLLTGVPGAGKTLVGLQFVYRHSADTPAIFLSGNQPLIAVLQYALRSKALVQPIRNYFIQYGVKKKTPPPEPVIVFDEAQRAWDQERMTTKYGFTGTTSDLILGVAETIPDWSVVLALIGEGQEIHLGEEGGIEQWDQALGRLGPWQIHCAPRFVERFAARHPQTHRALDLTLSLRSHLAADVQRWVNAVLENDLSLAQTLVPSLAAAGFTLARTRNLETAKAYCRRRYAEAADKRYGLIASSKATNLPRYGIRNDFPSTQALKVGPWYVDPPESADSCCSFERTATEFATQGLELDMPVVCWGHDLVWKENKWHSRVSAVAKAKDPHRLRVNSYRVLLSRGRDGMLLFVPPERAMDSTDTALAAAGVPSLDSGDTL